MNKEDYYELKRLLSLVSDRDNWESEKLYGPYGEYYKNIWVGNQEIWLEAEELLELLEKYNGKNS